MDRATSAAAYELMFHLLEHQLGAGLPAMIEANFKPVAAPRLAELVARHSGRLFQIRCVAARAVLEQRLRNRAANGERHPGHADDQTVQEIEELLSSGVKLDLEGAFVEIDTGAGTAPGDLLAHVLRLFA
ncbi:MAG: hypothetical protein ACT4OM_04750 [Actinomycetota bacterium]